MRLSSLLAFLVLACGGVAPAGTTPPPAAAAPAPATRPDSIPIPVELRGYDGELMEPFLSRDGELLFFNNRNQPAPQTDLHWARRVDDQTYDYLGLLAGANSSELDAVASMDRNGNFYFVTTRSYPQDLSTIYGGRFTAGELRDVRPVPGLAAPALGQVVFDAEVSADGEWLYGAQGGFSGGAVPDTADLFLARQTATGFERVESSVLASVNSGSLEYAAAISPDGLSLSFTRLEPGGQPAIFLARRSGPGEPFGVPARLDSTGPVVEAATFTPDGSAILYHRLEQGRFRLFRLTLE